MVNFLNKSYKEIVTMLWNKLTEHILGKNWINIGSQIGTVYETYIESLGPGAKEEETDFFEKAGHIE